MQQPSTKVKVEITVPLYQDRKGPGEPFTVTGTGSSLMAAMSRAAYALAPTVRAAMRHNPQAPLVVEIRTVNPKC